MTFNLSELFERVADAVPERVAVVTPTARCTYAQLDERSTRLAHALAGRGIRAGSHVGIQLHNGIEYIEAMLAAFKLRAVPININYRYVASELEYLYANADLAALVYHRSFAPQIADVLSRQPLRGPLFVVDDSSDAQLVAGSDDYESVVADASTTRDFDGRSGDDVYIAYTGGTTGLPKGVMWRHEDIFFAAMGGGDPTTLEGPIAAPEAITDRILEIGAIIVMVPPLMHVSAQWGAFSMLFGGGTVVLTAPGTLDPDKIWSLVAAEHANILTVVGDAMARPLLDALVADPKRYDLSSLFVFASGGAVLSRSTKAQIGDVLPNVITIDGFGSTETGVGGTQSQMPGADVEDAARFKVDERTAVLDDTLHLVAPGSQTTGRLARRGRIPLGYYNDPIKTAETFVEAAGSRWALTGDAATVESDGTIVLLGRGSLCINSGGEKVYPEEVEAVVKNHPNVFDVVVVGVPHERWGEQVVAVVAPRTSEPLVLDDVRDHCRDSLAGYKLPRALCLVDSIVRGPNGKADYRWARERALASAVS